MIPQPGVALSPLIGNLGPGRHQGVLHCGGDQLGARLRLHHLDLPVTENIVVHEEHRVPGHDFQLKRSQVVDGLRSLFLASPDALEVM